MRKLDVRKITLSSMLLALLILSAFLSIPIPFLAIKITLQTMVVFIISALLTPLYAFLTVLLYILLGLFGLPVFSTGGGIMYVFSPSFGFIIGFLVSAPIMSYINRSPFTTVPARYAFAGMVGIVIMYAIGITYLFLILKLYMGKDIALSYVIITYGLTFVPFDIIKAIAAYPLVSNKYIRSLTAEKFKNRA